MRGKPQLNFTVFDRAARLLRAMGHEVFNPADNDPTMDIRGAMREDLTWICQHAEAVAFLPGWTESKGAIAERRTAAAIGIKIIDLPSRGWDWPFCETEPRAKTPEYDAGEDD